MRVQRECNLTVRLRWTVAAGNHHPEATFTCAEDVDMAAEIALQTRLTGSAYTAVFAGVDVSPDGGRNIPWEPIDLDQYLAASREAAAASTTPQVAVSVR